MELVWKKTMSSVFIDESNDYMALIIGNDETVRKKLNNSLQRVVGKTVHMRELSKAGKFKVASSFMRTASKLSSEDKLKLVCAKKGIALKWLTKFIRSYILKRTRIPTFYVDRGIESELIEKIHPFYLRFMTIYESKPLTQSADVLSWINLRRTHIRFIWARLSKHIWEIGYVH